MTALPFNFLDKDIELQINSNVDAFKEKHKFSDFDLINLCGGVPIDGLTFLRMDAVSVSSSSAKVEIETEAYLLSRTINADLKIIFNDGMEVFHQGQGTGTKLFANQIFYVREKGFVRIQVFAKGLDAGRFNGAYTWARMGFQMIDYDHAEFADYMKRHKRSEMSLEELLSKEDGKTFWRVMNFSWTGKFDLGDGSKSMSQLIHYLKEKNMNVEF